MLPKRVFPVKTGKVNFAIKFCEFESDYVPNISLN